MFHHDPLIKPYLKWAGGKRQLLTDIKKYVPRAFDGYYEPFLGAGALFFNLQADKAVVNDFNEQLMCTYVAIRDDVDGLIGLLHTHREKNSQEYYYAIREQDRDKTAFNTLSNVEKAARLIYLNKTCYNGLYRVNAQGLFNVPHGRYKNPAIFDETTLRAISVYLKRPEITLLNGDFSQAVFPASKGDFVYFDPPYHSPGNTNFTGYQADGFDEKEQERLCEVFDGLSARGVMCLLSNSDTPFIRSLYQAYEIITVAAHRAINANGAGRGKVNELLIKNWRD